MKKILFISVVAFCLAGHQELFAKELPPVAKNLKFVCTSMVTGDSGTQQFDIPLTHQDPDGYDIMYGYTHDSVNLSADITCNQSNLQSCTVKLKFTLKSNEGSKPESFTQTILLSTWKNTDQPFDFSMKKYYGYGPVSFGVNCTQIQLLAK